MHLSAWSVARKGHRSTWLATEKSDANLRVPPQSTPEWPRGCDDKTLRCPNDREHV
jgi:hypothetical protein